MKIDSLFSKKQQEFLFTEDKRLNFLTGSVRSGKTHISLLKFAINVVATSPKGSEFLFSGKTLTTLKRNCLGLLLDLVGSSNFEYSLSSKEGRLFGKKIYFEGASDETAENKIRGMTLTGAYCDEITLMPESFVTMLLSRLSKPNAKLYATCNPDNPEHYIKKNYIDNKNLDCLVWEFSLKDNTFLDKKYVESITTEYTGVYYERYILGKWVRAEGLIYDYFANNYSDYSYNEEKDGKDFVFYNIGIDFGGNGSATTFVCTGFTRGYKKVVPVLAERHKEKLNPEELNKAFALFVKKCYNITKKPMNAYADSSEQILIRGLRSIALRENLQVYIHNARKMSINERIMLTCKLISQDRFRWCKEAITVKNALCEALWDTKHTDERLDDGTTDIDTLDAFEYSIEPCYNDLSKLIK